MTFIVLKVLDANGVRAHQRRHQRDRVRDGIQSFAGHRHHQSVARSSHLRTGSDRPLGPCGRSGRSRGDRGRRRRGQLRNQRGTGLPGYAGVTSPANAASAIAVGALKTFGTTERTDDRIATYSSRGPTWYDARVKVDLAAPGDKLIATAAKNSTLYRNYPMLHVGSGYMRLSGTSMAAGVVTGVTALMVEANAAASGDSRPKLTPNAVKAALQYTAFAVGTNEGISADMLTVGAGAVNAVGAIESAAGFDTSQPVGERWITSPLIRTTVIGGEMLAWSESVLWG